MEQYYLEPGLYTDQINPFDENGLNWPFLKDCGFTWASFLVYNPQLWNGVKAYDLPAVKAHGFSNVGVWGVVYSKDDYHHAGLQIAGAALQQQAQHIKVDAEQVYKDSKPNREGIQILSGIRDGGWTGGISLSTLGSPTNPNLFDFNMDTKTFLGSGPDACIEPQDYYNDYEEYTPKNSEIYWTRVGVPKDRISHTIGLYPGRRGKVSGAAWVGLLKDAGVKKNFSVYMAQHGMKADYLALKDHINSAAPVPATPPQPSASMLAKAEMTRIASNYLLNQLPNRQVFSRIRLAKRILQANDSQWQSISTEVAQLLNDAGVPQ